MISEKAKQAIINAVTEAHDHGDASVSIARRVAYAHGADPMSKDDEILIDKIRFETIYDLL